MDRIKILPLFAFAFSMSTLANDSKTINENNLYGLWNCKHTMEDRKLKMKIKIDYDVNVVRSGKSNGVGVLLFKIPNFPELAYSFSDSSQWKIKGGNLTLSSTELKLKNTSYPELEKMLNLRRLLPKNINESAKILELTKSKLKVQSKSDGGIYACSKIALKS
ncbi:MAG: hypothetical protein ACJAXJ_000844 [Colwellia sp.]|jgi:hypothetical protein